MLPSRSTIPLAIPDSPTPPKRLGGWLRRYATAEVAGLVTAMLGAYVARSLSRSEIGAAYGGSLGENIGFYGVIVGRELWSDRRACQDRGAGYGPRAWLRTAMNLGLEFGGAEALDSLIIRPLAMGVSAQYLGPQWGVIAGKLVADLVFYVPVVISYELRRTFQKSSTPP